MASSRSLKAVMIVAFLPPASANRRISGSAASIRRAVSVPPVRITASTFGVERPAPRLTWPLDKGGTARHCRDAGPPEALAQFPGDSHGVRRRLEDDHISGGKAAAIRHKESRSGSSTAQSPRPPRARWRERSPVRKGTGTGPVKLDEVHRFRDLGIALRQGLAAALERGGHRRAPGTPQFHGHSSEKWFRCSSPPSRASHRYRARRNGRRVPPPPRLPARSAVRIALRCATSASAQRPFCGRDQSVSDVDSPTGTTPSPHGAPQTFRWIDPAGVSVDPKRTTRRIPGSRVPKAGQSSDPTSSRKACRRSSRPRYFRPCGG